jgi:hypothetical protein
VNSRPLDAAVRTGERELSPRELDLVDRSVDDALLDGSGSGVKISATSAFRTVSAAQVAIIANHT